MKSFPLLVALAVAGAALPFAPVASAGHGADHCNVDTNSNIYTCTFVCHRGDQISISAHATGPATTPQYPRISASCGGVDIVCQQNWACEATSSDQVQTTSTGTCRAETVWMAGECRSIPTFDSQVYGAVEYAEAEGGRQVAAAEQAIRDAGETRSVGTSVGPYSTEEQESISIDTPYVARVCTAGDVLCVGPVQSIHVGNTPYVGPVEVVPLSGASVSFTDPVIAVPTVQYTSVGPYTVSGEPVPVIVCASTCSVPSGVTGGPSVSVTVTAYAGSFSRTVTLP